MRFITDFRRALRGQQLTLSTVPPNPLTAEGLATPYKQTGCNQLVSDIPRI
jgi:hypothetical protein